MLSGMASTEADKILHRVYAGISQLKKNLNVDPNANDTFIVVAYDLYVTIQTSLGHLGLVATSGVPVIGGMPVACDPHLPKDTILFRTDSIIP